MNSNDSNDKNFAWEYFELHANQRISLFRFYILIFSLYISTKGYLIMQFDKSSCSEEIIAIFLSP